MKRFAVQIKVDGFKLDMDGQIVQGFYTTRFAYAKNKKMAGEKACKNLLKETKVRDLLDSDSFRGSLNTVVEEVMEISLLSKIFSKPGLSFYL